MNKSTFCKMFDCLENAIKKCDSTEKALERVLDNDSTVMYFWPVSNIKDLITFVLCDAYPDFKCTVEDFVGRYDDMLEGDPYVFYEGVYKYSILSPEELFEYLSSPDTYPKEEVDVTHYEPMTVDLDDIMDDLGFK